VKEKIFIIQTSFLGDAVLTLPMIQKLKEIFPNSSISVLCIPSTKEIFDHSSDVDDVIVYDKRDKQKSLSSFIGLIKLIRKNKFSRIYSPHRSFRTSMLVLFSGTGTTFGFDISSCSFIYRTRIQYIKSKHEVARNLDLIGYDTSDEKWKVLPKINIPDAITNRVDRAINGLDIKMMVAIAPGSVWNTKIYPRKYFEEVIKYLVDNNIFVILIGGSDDEKLCRGIEEKFNVRVKSFAGKLSAVESVALLKKCALLISNDSAPTHLGMIADIPTITIYCSTIPEFGFFPYNQKSRSISLDGLECKPCGIHGHRECPLKTFDCGNKLLPEVMIAWIKEILVQ
jgi:heptosyltransferase-2